MKRLCAAVLTLCLLTACGTTAVPGSAAPDAETTTPSVVQEAPVTEPVQAEDSAESAEEASTPETVPLPLW